MDDFNDLVFDESSADYFAKRVKDNSALIAFNLVAQPAQPPIAAETTGMLANGNDARGIPSTVDFRGDDPDPSKRAGLAALLLDDYHEVALVYEPDINEGLRA